MKKLKLSRKELVIIDLIIFVLVIKFAYEPVTKNINDVVQMYLDRALLFVWFIIGIMLLTFCFSNLFSAIQIFIKKKKLNIETQEYIYRTQEFYIKLNNAKYFAKIFFFIYLLFNSMFIMGILFMIYNLSISILDFCKLKHINSQEKEYNETLLRINSELQNVVLYSLIINISYFYLRYNSVSFQYSQGLNDTVLKFIIGIAVIIIQLLVYFLLIRKKIVSSTRLVKYSTKYIIVVLYVLFNFAVLNFVIYLLSHNI